jgi:membrane protease YdiL (CAAX protease family)
MFNSASISPDEEEHDVNEKRKWLFILIVFYSFDLVVCCLVNFLPVFRGLQWLLVTQVALAVLTIVFKNFMMKALAPLFRWRSFAVSKALVYGIAAMMFAVVVNLVIAWLNKSIFNEDVHFFRSFSHLDYPRLSMILLVAILPALFEELAYRGIILHSLLKLADERQAIHISAFLFAIIHMSFISMFWLVPFAIWLGNVRIRERTIWFSVLIHFCFNLTACLFEFYELGLFKL